ncbi:MAG: hypothetical protein COW65_01225 [Cytophagales bacterium CG18_big_fil_WC_8_21_14_2_50_42_9]|nr:MAG: hypothetical protein COW65_01225 [Cytophagales bacterium CG18_big_fil_WC_8_21_14_2_50_42_9]
MQVFLFVNLTDAPSFSYQQPILQWVKEIAPATITLDMDTFSEELLVSQACRLLQEATSFIVYFKTEAKEAPFRAAQKVVEELIWKDKPGTVLLEGQHRRLQLMLPARSHISFQAGESAEALKPFLRAALTATT